jgi:aspartate/glutamate racemase
MSRKPIVGIIGGMGNEAMVDIARKMTFSPSKSYVFFGNSQLAYTPFELANFREIGPRADKRKLTSFVHTMSFMQGLNCDHIGMACNSGHTFIRQIKDKFESKFIDMVKLTADASSNYKNTLILGTTSLIEDGLYQQELIDSFITPPKRELNQIMDAVYNFKSGVKSGGVNPSNYKKFKESLSRILKQDPSIDSIILGCTELPLFFNYKDGVINLDVNELSRVVILNATEILADRLSEAKSIHDKRITNPENFKKVVTYSYKPMVFRCKTIKEMAIIQSLIIKETTKMLRKFNISSGSFLHLPTLFLVNYDHELPVFVETETDTYLLDGDFKEKFESHTNVIIAKIRKYILHIKSLDDVLTSLK